MIVLNNALWTPYFPHIALKQRLLLLPFCLRKQPGCPADHDDLGLICKGCGQCDIPGLSAAADELDMPVLVAESSSAVADWVEQGVIQAVVGVSCGSGVSVAGAGESVKRFHVPALTGSFSRIW